MRVKMDAGSGDMGSCRIPRGTAADRVFTDSKGDFCDMQSIPGGRLHKPVVSVRL